MLSLALATLLAPALPAQVEPVVPGRYFRTFSHSHPVLKRIRPGEKVFTRTLDSGGQDEKGVQRSDPYNPLNGPFFIEGAEPGDALVVTISKLAMNRDWGWSGYRLGLFALTPEHVEHVYSSSYKPDLVRKGRTNLVPWDLDLKRKTVRLREPRSAAIAMEFPAQPMLGCIGVAPAGDFAPTSGPSGAYGGNLDYNKIGEGAIVSLPVYHEGGLLFVGDGHALQADGEPTGTGIETSMDVEFSVAIKKGTKLTGPRVETRDEIITIGSQPEFASALDNGLKMATSDMTEWLVKDYGLEPWAAHLLVGYQGKYDVVTVAGSMALRIPKNRLPVARAPAPPVAAVAAGVVAVATATEEPGQPGLVRSEFVYELAPFPKCHASTLAESAGVLVAAWFGGTNEGQRDVGIWLARKEDRGWTTPVEVATGETADTRYPCWNPVLFQPKEGPLLLFYKVGPSPARWWGMLVTSDDGGKTWSNPRRLPEGILGPIKNKPIALGDGSLLCPSSTEDHGWQVHFERTTDLGRSWERIGPINDGVKFSAIQPTLLTYADGRIQALCRSRQKQVLESWSSDRGKTWSDLAPTALPNPSSGIDGVTLADGRQLLIYNHTPRGRTPLNLAMSPDGATWRSALVLEDQPGEYSYPAIIQTSDGLVHIAYTWKRTKIRHVVVDPAKLELRDLAKSP